MEQTDIWKNLTGTVCVLGLALSSMNFNSTQVVESVTDVPMANYGTFDDQAYNYTNSVAYLETNSVYLDRHESKYEAEAESLFGKMREATVEESTSVNNYVKSISKDTGVNFFDLC